MLYDAWGNVTYDYNEELDSLGMLDAMNIASINNVTYRGYFYDFETGLYYLQSRYYDPETGRFINADDTAYIGYDSSPISTNIFAYCANNPVKYSDPHGKWIHYKKYDGVIVNIYGGAIGHADITIDQYTIAYGVYTKNVRLPSKIVGTAPGYFVIAYAFDWERYDKITNKRTITNIRLKLTEKQKEKLLYFYFIAMGTSDIILDRKVDGCYEGWEIYKAQKGKYANYSVFSVNCTTVIVEALLKVLNPKLIKKTENKLKTIKFEKIIKPSQLKKFLLQYNQYT